MGICTCKQGQISTPTSYGGTLNFVWSEGNNSWTWHGPKQYCNPYNCSNTRCRTNGCAQARAGFCATFGKDCPGGKKCYGTQGQDPCPDYKGPGCVHWNPMTWGDCLSGACHMFDFIPGGGCTPYAQLALLLGGIAVVVMILKNK